MKLLDKMVQKALVGQKLFVDTVKTVASLAIELEKVAITTAALSKTVQSQQLALQEIVEYLTSSAAVAKKSVATTPVSTSTTTSKATSSPLDLPYPSVDKPKTNKPN